jgi:DNA polymerase III delta subunit
MIIIHGEDKALSYKKLIEVTDELKKKDLEIFTYDVSELEITSFRQQISSTSLFGTIKCIVIKNLLGTTKSKIKDQIIALISTAEDQEIILYETKDLSATALKPFPQAKVEHFKVNPLIFKFLDTLRPQNRKQINFGWQKMLEEGIEPEFIFAMLTRQVRLLIQAKSGPSYLKLGPYPLRLITSQASSFTLDQLLNLHKELYQIDLKIKTGASPVTIEHLLGNFIQKI